MQLFSVPPYAPPPQLAELPVSVQLFSVLSQPRRRRPSRVAVSVQLFSVHRHAPPP